MPNYVTDTAICLRVADFSETSQIVGLFTRLHGLVPLIAKGSKRASKKNVMSGPLDLLTGGQAVFILPKESASYSPDPSRGSSGLGLLASWELINHRAQLRRSLPALNAATLCAEATTHLLQPLDPHAVLFDQLEAAFDLLALSAQRARGVVAYLKAALTEAGYWPQFSACLACGRLVMPESAVRFAPHSGGVFCELNEGCNGVAKATGPLIALQGRVALALDRLPLPLELLKNPPERPADEKALVTALDLLVGYTESIAGKGMRTRYLIKSVGAA